MAELRIGVAPWGGDLGEWVEVAGTADAAGLDAVWTSELHRSPFVPLAAAATSTTDVALGTAIALAFARSPFSAAITALDLDELSGGRLRLGLGTGVKRLIEGWHGKPFERPAQRLREWVGAFRTVVARAHLGDPMESEGELISLSVRGYTRPEEPTRTSIPIYLASVGPVMTALAGETAQGWISHELSSAQSLREQALPALERGWTTGGRSRADVEIVASACCVIDDDPGTARRIAANTVAFYASVRTYEEHFAAHGFRNEAVAIQAAFRDGDTSAMVDAVSDAMVETFTLAGTEDQVLSALKRFDGLVDAVKLSPPTYFVDADVTRTCQKRTLELFAN